MFFNMPIFCGYKNTISWLNPQFARFMVAKSPSYPIISNVYCLIPHWWLVNILVYLSITEGCDGEKIQC